MSANGPVEPDLTVVAGNPTAVELAAVTAVLVSVLQERDTNLASVSPGGLSGWQRSQRPVQLTIVPGPRVWRNFSA